MITLTELTARPLLTATAVAVVPPDGGAEKVTCMLPPQRPELERLTEATPRAASAAVPVAVVPLAGAANVTVGAVV